MLLRREPFSILGLAALTTSISIANAVALLSEHRLANVKDSRLVERTCSPCGYYNQVCCEANESCIKNANNEAECRKHGGGDPAAQGGWQYSTSTYVMTDKQTITTTISSFVPVVTQNLVPDFDHGQCRLSMKEIPCGDECCKFGEYCMSDRLECAAVGGDSSALYSTLFTMTQPASVPVRPTSNTVFTVTSTGIPTTTVPYQAPVGTDGSPLIDVQASTSGGGLSSGAIAGIVIGVIVGIIILLLICLCCCAKGAIDGIKGLFKSGSNRRTEKTTYVSERHTHRGSRPASRTWFGSRPTRVDRAERRSSGLGPMAKVGAGLGTMGIALGLKRKMDRRHNAKTESSYSRSDDYYTDTSPSSASSVTRDSRRIRR